MKRSPSSIVLIPVEPELKKLAKEAAAKTRLSQSEVMRTALRIGIPQVVKRLEVRPRPRRNFIQYFHAFAGLVKLRHVAGQRKTDHFS
jgi:hypothetical protein